MKPVFSKLPTSIQVQLTFDSQSNIKRSIAEITAVHKDESKITD